MIELIETSDLSFILKLQEQFGNRSNSKWLNHDFYRWENYGGGYLRVKEKEKQEVEIGYVIFPEYRGQKLSKILVKSLILKAQEEFPTFQIKAHVPSENKISAHVLETLGFVSIWSESYTIYHFPKDKHLAYKYKDHAPVLSIFLYRDLTPA